MALDGRPLRTDEHRATVAAIGGRLRLLRAAFAKHVGPTRISLDLPRRLGISHRSWLNWEQGVSIPGEVLLLVVVATGVRPAWLLSGDGPMLAAPDDVRARESGDAA
jgi:transcriptional regulator with XRE-family HTH domain